MILITGGTGFLGGHLLYHLVKKGERVKALKRLGSSTALTEKIFSFYTENHSELFDKIEWVVGDVLDIQSLEKAFDGVDFIYHTAAIVSFDPKDKGKLLETNVNGTANVVNIALSTGVKKLCYVSSTGALGREGNDGITNEKSPWIETKGISTYSLSKYEAEMEVWRGIAEGLNAVIVNPSVILGPGNWNKGSSQLFTTVFKGLKVYTMGTNGYVDVNDVVKAMVWLMERNISGERFVLNSENVPYKQLFQWTAEALHVKPPSIKAGSFLSTIAWRTIKIFSMITRKPPFITSELARTANKVHQYSAEKIKKASGMRFIPIKESIRKSCDLFLKENI